MLIRSLLIAILIGTSLPAAVPKAPTFYKHVLPVLQARCQACHRPGEAAPMSFLTYESTRPWAAAIREAVRTQKMPPWGADPAHGKFANDPTLTRDEKETLIAWVEAKAPAGDRKDAPKPVKWVEGWNIGEPDLVVSMPKSYDVPEDGTIEYTRFILPLNFTEDRWVAAAEVRPGNRAVVHHVIAYTREPDSKWLKDAPLGEPIVKVKGSDGGPRGTLAGYAPGVPQLPPVPGRAMLVKAGTQVVLEMHYTTNGKPATDLTKVGLVFAKEDPREAIGGFAAANSRFAIPPGADAYEVKSKWVVPNEMILTGLTPHMHLRGKDFEYTATYPTGEKEVLLRVPRYDFNWQHTYVLAQPKVMPAGTTLECVAHFDNSPNNRFNPDPKKEVRWGDQSWDEMMIGFGQVIYDARRSEKEVFTAPRKDKPATPAAE
ncbi:MAG: cytochrome c [Bryobacteraceae bacterium]|nr:cytochrome c [Bryobacteraceae bacterium]